jgi:hypothetical protein
MDISDIDSTLIDRIVRKQQVTDQELWDKFWSMTEEDARAYAKVMWFAGRHVTQNHITRKVKRFWPRINDGVSAIRAALKADPTHPKVFRVFNYDYEYGGTLCHVMAGTRAEAIRTAELFLPQTAIEAGHQRFCEHSFIAPIEDARTWCAIMNANLAAEMSEKINDNRRSMRDQVRRYEVKIAKIEARRDAFQMLMSTVGMAVDPNPDPEGDTNRTEVDF